MVTGSSDKEYEHPSTSELPENKLRHNFLLGDMTWVKHNGTSWWPAQVIDEACVGSKPKKKGKYDCLVRLYGTCQYLYVDPWKSNTEFKMMLKQEGKSATEVFHEVLEKELSCVNLSKEEEECDNSEGTQTKVTTKKASSRKDKKQEGLKKCSYTGVKKAATAEYLEDESKDLDQEVGSTKGKRRRGRKSSSSHDTVQTLDKDSCDSSAESLRGKRKKQGAHVLDKEGCKIGASAVRRETRSSAKKYLYPAEDRTASLTDATEDAVLPETSAPHTEIKAMVRDILFKEIIEREHDADMAYVDQVINGICSTTVDSMTGSTGVQGEPNTVTEREREGKSDRTNGDTMQLTSPQTKSINSKDNASSLKEAIDTTPGCSDEGNRGT